MLQDDETLSSEFYVPSRILFLVISAHSFLQYKTSLYPALRDTWDLGIYIYDATHYDQLNTTFLNAMDDFAALLFPSFIRRKITLFANYVV